MLSVLFGLARVGRVGLEAHAVYSLGLWAAARVLGADRRGSTETQRIACLVVAHDEASVIAACVRSLREQDYPREAFDVFVVADNCSDATAALAAREGATVLERKTERPEGKPAAVAFGVAQIAARGSWDAIAVFDADNVIDAGFLSAIASRLGAGEQVVQGFVDAKNPDASWIAAASAIGFWVIDGLVQRPRERLGLSASLMGTGFAARPELFPAALAISGALTDDIEANARLALRGVRVAYEPRARTLDEKPTRMDVATAQRQRWMQGRAAAVERWLPLLVSSAVAPQAAASPMERLRALDVAVQLVSPSLLFSSTALATLSSSELALRLLTGRGGTNGAVGSLALAAVCFLLPATIVAHHRPRPRVWAAYLLQPAYVLQSVPLALRGWLTRRERRWSHTRHAG